MDSKKSKIIFAFVVILFVVFGGLLVTSGNGMQGDEPAHAVQIQHFLDGEYVFLDSLTIPITYHLMIYSIAKPLGIYSLFGLRIISCLLVIFLLFPAAYLLTRNLQKTLQIVFFPIMFVYMFLVYSDLFSLALVLLSFYFVTKQRYWISGIIGTISVFVRQTNVFWLGFIFLYGYIQYVDKEQLLYLFNFKNIIEYLKKSWIFILGVILFVGFIFYTGGVLQGDADAHPVSFHMGNLYMFLFLFFMCFLPYCLGRFKESCKILVREKWIGLAMLAIGIGAMIHHTTHPYNYYEGIWFNLLLVAIENNIFVRIVFSLIVMVSVLTILTTKLEYNGTRGLYWIYPVAIAQLGLSWLIEIRYSFVLLVFFLIFYKNEGKLETMTTIYYILIALMWFMTLVVNPA